MNTKAKYIILCAVGLAAGLASCSTDEDFYYQDEPRVRLAGPSIWTAGSDSLTFSFVSYPAQTTQTVMDVEAIIMGEVSNQDRTVSIVVDNAKTTATADLYEVPSQVTIPAGQGSATFAVTLKRGAVLTQQSARLYIKVGESADFKTGVNEENHLLLVWNDILSRPANWAELEEFFGQYSNVKYRFMLENSDGIGEFDASTMSWALLQSYKIKFQNALNAYNAAHPGAPLTDENGQLVSFE